MQPEMPFNYEVEKELLAIMLNHTHIIPFVSKKITQGMFYKEENRNIFQSLLYLYNTKITFEPMMVMEALKERFSEKDGDFLIAEIMHGGITDANVEWYLDQIVMYASRRKLVKLSILMQKYSNDLSKDVNEVLLAMNSTISLVQSAVKADVNLADDIEDMSLALGNKDATIPFGIPVLDRKVAGVMRQDITTLGGRTSHGKTTFTIDTVRRQVERGFSTDLITNEVAKRLYLQKLACNIANIEYQKIIKFGDVSDEEREKFGKAKQHMLDNYVGKLRVHEFVDNINAITGIIGANKPDVFWLDWLQRIPLVPGVHDERVWIKIVYSELAKISAKANTAVVVVSQLSTRKAQARGNKRPELFDFDDSSFIEKASCDCHLLYWNYNDTRIDEHKTIVELINAKNRFGEPSLSLLSHDPRSGKYNDSKLIPRDKIARYAQETGLTIDG